MLVNDIAWKLERQSLRDSEEEPAKKEFQTSVGCGDKKMSENRSSSLIRGSNFRLSLPFSNNKASVESVAVGAAADRDKAAPTKERESEELPIKRRHLSWAAADFYRINYAGVSAPEVKSMTQINNDGEKNTFEIVKPVAVRPVFVGSALADDSNAVDFVVGSGNKKHDSNQPNARLPRPSSASSGIFDLDSSSDCSARRTDQLDSFTSTGWSSADERRQSDEVGDNGPRKAALTGTRSLAKATSGHNRHYRVGSRLSISGGFLPLSGREAGAFAMLEPLNPSSSASREHADNGGSAVGHSMTSNWWRSAPDLVNSISNDVVAGERNADGSYWRRSHRKRQHSGSQQSRPSIDLFKNVDDDSSCGDESYASNENAASSAGIVTECTSLVSNNGLTFTVTTDSSLADLEGTTRTSCDVSDDEANTGSDANLSSASTRSATNPKSSNIAIHHSQTEPTAVTRSLSYPWLRCHTTGDDSNLDDVQKSLAPLTGYKAAKSNSKQVAMAMIDDGLRTIVGSPADTAIAIRHTNNNSNSNSNNNDSPALPSPNINRLLNFVPDCVGLTPNNAAVDSDSKNNNHGKPIPSPSSSPPSPSLQQPSVAADELDDDTGIVINYPRPPELVTNSSVFLNFNFKYQTELDIDLIEKN